MKVLYHHRTVSKDGQNVHIEEMIAAMRELGHEVVVVAPRIADQTSFGYDGGLVSRIKRLVPDALYEILELSYSLFAFIRLYRAWRRHKPDVLYERYNLFFVPGLWLKHCTNIPYLLEINAPLAHERAAHGSLKLKRLAKWCEGLTWRGADMALPVTGVLARFLTAANVPKERIAVIPNGIDIGRFSHAADGAKIRRMLGLEDKIVLGFTGFIREWHGLETVVEAMAAMEDKDRLHLLLVGDGPAKGAIMDRAERLGLSKQVSFLGIVPRDKVAEHIAAFDIALHPKVVEYASPLKLFEYMGLARAIIAPDQDNIREVLVDGENALLFRQDDERHFRDQLSRLCRDETLRARLGRAAERSIAERGLSWQNNARRVMTMASALLAERVALRSKITIAK